MSRIYAAGMHERGDDISPSYNRSMTPWKAQIRRLGRDFALSIAFWLPLSQLVGWQAYLTERTYHLPVVLPTVLLVYAVRYLTVAILTPPIFYLVTRWPATGAIVPRAAAYALGYIPFSLAFAALRWSLLPPFSEQTASFGSRTLVTLFQLAYETFADVLLLYLVIVVAAHAYVYFVRGQRQEIERLELRQSLAQSELQALRAQLHPHFLFNTLQGISTLIETDRVAAQNMLLTLAALLRTVLKHGSTDLVPFREELAFVRAYLDLEQMRFATRHDVRWQIAAEAYDTLIPQLLLQPLIENAVVHGIAKSHERGWISVEASVSDGQLHIRITNSVAGAAQPGLGLGLVNIRARLKYLFSDDAHFEFQVHSDAGRAVAQLELPAFTTVIADKCAGVRAMSEQ
ncbi:MAG: sensor histidine kinase [Steroidobacteraceae bacterium]